MLTYNEFTYLWPPRPEKKVMSGLLNFYQKKGWWAQFKKNGTCSVIALTPEGELIPWGRHEEPHKAWQFTENSSRAFKNLPKGWYVFVAELMHSKVPGLRDINYINDILVHNGDYLVGTTFEYRAELLKKLFLKGDEQETVSHYIVDDNLWLAKNHKVDFKKMWDEIENPEDEGLVCKNPNAELKVCSKSGANTDWQIKCRKPTKNYSF